MPQAKSTKYLDMRAGDRFRLADSVEVALLFKSGRTAHVSITAPPDVPIQKIEAGAEKPLFAQHKAVSSMAE